MPEHSLLIIKNITHEGPGLLESLLHELGIASHVEELSQGGTFPDPRNYRAVVVLGGPQSANDKTPAMQLQLRQIEIILEDSIPFLGICLGMQALVKAGGGNVIKSPIKETGFTNADGIPYHIDLTNAGKVSPLFAGLESSITVFQLHGETVELAPSGMELLATSHNCKNQVVKVGANAYGLQCHFEMTRPMFSDLISIDHDLRQMDSQSLLAQFDALYDEYTATGRMLMDNFLRIAGLV